MEVSSYWVEPAAALIDPMLPAEGVEWFQDREHRPAVVLLTNRHHYRAAGRFVEAFGARVLCHDAGLHEFEGGPEVAGFAFGDEVAPGITAHEVGAICPEETALHIRVGPGALAVADGVVNWPGGEIEVEGAAMQAPSGLGFVPDFLLGEDPEEVKRGLCEAYSRLLALEFEALLPAHGEPMAPGGKAALVEFLADR
jgi:hypothetical protein